MIPMVTTKALLHDLSTSAATSCALRRLETAMKRKVTVRRSQDTARHCHTDAVNGCNRASGMAVIAGCRNIRGHLHRKQTTPITPLPRPNRYGLKYSGFEPSAGIFRAPRDQASYEMGNDLLSGDKATGARP